MARTRSRRRTHRRPRISTARRRAAALKGWRRRKASGRRPNPRRRARRNVPGLFLPPRRKTSLRVRARRVSSGRRRGRFSKRGGRRQTLYSRPGRRLAAARRSLPRRLWRKARPRRRNPNGFLGQLQRMDTWVNALQIASGAVASGLLAGWAYNQFAPAALQTENAKMIGRPASIAISGALIGWGVSAAGQKKLAKQLALGGIIAAALDVVQQIGRRAGFLGYGGGMADYIQLQGYGTQAQVEAGVFGYGTQAQVEAGDFSDYIQLQGMGHTEDEMAEANTFGPTF